MSTPLETIVETFSEALRRGTTPNIDTIIARYPEHATALKHILPTLLTLEDFAQETSGIPHEADLPLPMVLGNEFRLERKLGYGGMGTVFEAVQIPLARRCAVKVLARHLAANPRHRKAFIREARLIGNLHHPQIVKVISAGETSDYAYYAMELIEGGSSLERFTPESPRQLLYFAVQTAQALSYIHQCNLTHCDIKPSNLLIDAGQRLLISDFGLAQTPKDSAIPSPQTYGGTRAYQAPEYQSSPAADQYAFGRTFWECFENLGPLSPDLTAILSVCTAPDPTHRYPSMDAVAEDLRHLLAGEPVSARPASPLRRLWLWSRRNPLVATLASLLTIGIPTFLTLLAIAHHRTRAALDIAETNLAVADTALACTFEHVGQDEPSRRAAVLLEALIPYYRDVIKRRDTTPERIASAEGIIGQVALRTGDTSNAVAAFQRQLKAFPTLQTQNRLAEALSLSGDIITATQLQQEIALHLDDTHMESRIEAIRACANQTMPDALTLWERALQAVRPLRETHPENPDIQHLHITLIERLTNIAPHLLTPEETALNLDEARVTLATEHLSKPDYGIAALNRITRRLNQTDIPLTQEDEHCLNSVRTLAKQLLGKWQDDPQVLLATVQFAVADSSRIRRSPRHNLQAMQQNERLFGALEVLFFGSSLPEDTKTPLFDTLFNDLLSARQKKIRERTEHLRRRIQRENNRPRKWSRSRTKATTP